MMKYFRDRARELGCKEVDKLGDLVVWKYIIKYQEAYLWMNY